MDYYHASEHIYKAAEVIYDNSEEAQEWAEGYPIGSGVIESSNKTLPYSFEVVRSVVRGKGKPCGALPHDPASPVRVYAPSFAKEGHIIF